MGSHHPVWNIAHTVVIMGGLALILSVTAVDFDGGETTAVIGSGVLNQVFSMWRSSQGG